MNERTEIGSGSSDNMESADSVATRQGWVNLFEAPRRQTAQGVATYKALTEPPAGFSRADTFARSLGLRLESRFAVRSRSAPLTISPVASLPRRRGNQPRQFLHIGRSRCSSKMTICLSPRTAEKATHSHEAGSIEPASSPGQHSQYCRTAFDLRLVYRIGDSPRRDLIGALVIANTAKIGPPRDSSGQISRHFTALRGVLWCEKMVQ